MIVMKYVKKVARNIVWRMPSSFVAMFHHVTIHPEVVCGCCMLQESRFKDFINSFHDYGTLEECVNYPSHKKVGITFDDGSRDVYTIAYPFLKEKNVPFTVFVVTDFINKNGYLTEKELCEMAKDPLVTIGSHGTSHKAMSTLSRDEIRRELVESKRILQDVIGQKIDCFAYPYGDYEEISLEFAQENYDFAMSVIEHPINFIMSRNRHLVPRYNVDETTYIDQKRLFEKYCR